MFPDEKSVIHHTQNALYLEGEEDEKLKLRLTYLWYKWLMKLGLKSDEVYYIGGSEALPPPLSKEEEQVLLLKLPSGDQAARTILIERNLRLVVYIARKFENTGINIEDLISIGTIGLIKAVNTFNPEKKIKLATTRRDVSKTKF